MTRDAIATAKNNVGSQIDSIAQQNQMHSGAFRVLAQPLLDEVDRVGTSDAKDAMRKWTNELLLNADQSTGFVPGDAWRQANTQLNTAIRSSSGDVKNYLGQLSRIYKQTMRLGVSPQQGSAWDAANTMYRNAKTIEPLAKKAGDDGINPTLLMNRTAAANNQNGTLGDMADLGKYLAAKTPNSGTAQHSAILKWLGHMTSGLGAVAGFAGTHSPEGGVAGYAAGATLPFAGGLLNRALNSQPVAQAIGARMPETLAAPLRDLSRIAPLVGGAYSQQPADDVRDLQSKYQDIAPQYFR